MTRSTVRTVTTSFALVFAVCLGVASKAAAQTDGSTRARSTVEQNAERILFFAHPTVTYSGIDYLGVSRTFDGKNRVGYTFRFVSAFGNKGWTTLYFVHGEMGSIQRIDNGGTSGLIQPFFASNTAINLVKSYLREKEEIKNNAILLDAIERADAKGLLLLLLP